MGKFLKAISITLIFSVILQLNIFGPSNRTLASEQTDQYKGIPEDDVAEIESAIALGLLTKTMSVQGNITAKELITILTNCIKLRKGDTKVLTGSLKNTSAKTVWRQDAALALYYAAKAMKVYKPNRESGPSPLDIPNGIKWTSNLFSDWESQIPVVEGKTTINYPKIMYACIFACQHQSIRDEKRLMVPDKNNKFNFTSYMTRKDAILAAYRLYNSFLKKPVYVALDKAGTNTIPKDLLSKKSTLPEVTNRKIPQYRGFYLNNKPSVFWVGDDSDRKFRESEIRFLSENDLNFVRVNLGFSTLNYPDYPEGKVNLNELEDLDYLISMGIKHNVHINIAMYGLPGFVPKGENSFITAGELDMNSTHLFGSPRLKELVLKYWQMLAKRYSNIPPKYLSFLLQVEPTAPNDRIYTETFAPVVQAMRKENPNRVIFSYANAGEPCEGLAKMGCALAWSFYAPAYINLYGACGDELTAYYSYLEPPKWPVLYLPCNFDGHNERKNKLVINGAFTKGTLKIYVSKKYIHSDTVLTLISDNKEIISKHIDVSDKSNKSKWPQEEYDFPIPASSKKLELKVNEEGWLQYGRIQLTQDGKKTINLYPHDLYCDDVSTVMPTLNVSKDGTISVVEKDLKVDFDYLYNWNIKSNFDLAKKYNVGFLISEWGPFGAIPNDARVAYLKTILDGFNKYGIPWCFNDLAKDGGLLAPSESVHDGYSEDWKYKPLAYDDNYCVNVELQKLFQQKIKK